MRAFFVTGTDTEVGKTTVSAALLRKAKGLGLSTAAMKPIESGCQACGDSLVGMDWSTLSKETTIAVDPAIGAPFRYKESIAPGVAARQSGSKISLRHIEECFRKICDMDPDFLLVEGAGGLLVPISDSLLVSDLALRLGLPLIIVARAGLGTINHTLSTVRIAQSVGLKVAGFYLNRVNVRHVEFYMSNAQEITRFSKVPCLGTLPEADLDSLAKVIRIPS